jgi:hypothetical protein
MDIFIEDNTASQYSGALQIEDCVPCSTCESLPRLQSTVAELLYKNQRLKFEIRDARVRLREIEALLFSLESHSPCLHTRGEILLVLRSILGSSGINPSGRGIEPVEPDA